MRDVEFEHARVLTSAGQNEAPSHYQASDSHCRVPSQLVLPLAPATAHQIGSMKLKRLTLMVLKVGTKSGTTKVQLGAYCAAGADNGKASLAIDHCPPVQNVPSLVEGAFR
jgi:hypothetical protein